MITLTVIAYIFISLCAAIYTYNDRIYDRMAGGNINDSYKNVGKSLIYGFLVIPSFIAAIVAAFYFAKCVAFILTWITTNLP